MDNRIKILLIDDEPKLINKLRNLKGYAQHPEGSKAIPMVWYDSELDDLAGRYNWVEDAFVVKWLQAPKDIKNYLALTKELMNGFSKEIVSEIGFVPDIVVYDYSLTHGMNNVVDFSDEIIALTSPNPNMIEFLQKNGWDMSIEDRNIHHAIPVGQDTLGLFLSNLIIEMYSQYHPCLGIPITFFGNNLARKDARIYEWVVNEYFDDVLQWEGKSNKRWNEIIDFALPRFRKRFLSMIRDGRIRIDLDNLFKLIGPDFSSGDLSNYDIKFGTAYGQRKISFNFLFIDSDPVGLVDRPNHLKPQTSKTVITERELSILTFIKGISDELVKSANIGIGINDFFKARKIGDEIYNEYLSNFEDRIDLSEYYLRRKALNKQEQERFTGLLTSRKFNIDIAKSLITKETSILQYKNRDSSSVIRLAILYIVANASITLNQLSFRSKHKTIYKALEDEEIYYLLNPIANTARKANLILPMHMPTQTDIRNILTDFGISVKRIWEKTHPPTTGSNFYDISSWITPGERVAVRVFFHDKQEKLLPDWLKN